MTVVDTRAPVRGRILESLRHDIVSGLYAPGERLPPRTDLRRRYDASPVTVQSAMDQLIADGFVRTSHGSGTFVADYPPHLHRYALVMPPPNDQIPGALGWALSRCLDTWHDPDRQIVSFLNFDAHTDNVAYQRLLRDYQHECLAGILFLHNPWPLAQSPLVTDPGLRKVVLGSSSAVHDLPCVDLSDHSLCDRAVDRVAAAGRRRVAVVTALQPPDDEAYFHDAIASRGLEEAAHGYLILGASTDARHMRGITDAVWLLLNQPPDRRPDALILTEYLLLDAVLPALRELGLQPGRDLEVISHAILPLPTPPVDGVRYLGFDAGRTLAHGLAMLTGDRRGVEIQTPRYLEEWGRLPIDRTGDK